MTPALRSLLNYPRIGAPDAPKRMAVLCKALMASDWWQRRPCIKIVGSNAKGTTAHITAAWAQDLGKRVGLFTSPHILHVEERIAINGNSISPSDLEACLKWAVKQASNLEGVGRFEILTLSALKHFCDQNVDLAVMEIGLGGRLDPVRIAPGNISILTSLDLEHTQLLGNTLTAIGAEKAHVCEAGDRLICGHRLAPASVPTGVEMIDLSQSSTDPLERNILLAQKALELFFDHPIKSPCPPVTIPARLQQISDVPTAYLDVAHTPAAIQVLIDHLPQSPLCVIFALRKDKDLHQIAQLLKPRLHKVFACCLSDDMYSTDAIIDAFGPEVATPCLSVAEAWGDIQQNHESDDIFLFLGGFSLAAHVFAHLQGLDPKQLITL